MDVSFTGMQNIGVTFRNGKANPKAFVNRIAIQLNNNGEKDLDAFKTVLKTHSDCFKSNFLDIIFDSTPNLLNPKKPYLDVFINMKKVEMNQENLPVFEKINNLLKRISKDEEKTPITEGYLGCENCVGRYFSEIYGNEEKPKSSLIKDIHDIDLVKAVSHNTSKVLSKVIENFYIFGNKEVFKEVKGIGGFHYANPAKEIDRFYLELKKEDVKVFEKFFWNRELMPTFSNKLLIDLHKNEASQETSLALNNIPLEINDENFPIIRKVVQLLKGIKETDKELPFPKDYLSDDSFNEISKWAIKEDNLKKMYNADIDQRLEREFELDLITYDKSAKNMADKFITTIDKKIKAYFE